jgi:biopolymer transport protein ExbD
MQLSEDKPYDDINITPMLDLAYVLLVIFILMTTASVQGMKVTLPKVDSKGPPLSRPKTKSVTVNAAGVFFVDATAVSGVEQLEKKLTELKARNPNMSIVLRGDRQAAYKGIMEVLDVCGRIGLTDIGLVTSKK